MLMITMLFKFTIFRKNTKHFMRFHHHFYSFSKKLPTTIVESSDLFSTKCKTEGIPLFLLKKTVSR